jgi:hypothetical protein
MKITYIGRVSIENRLERADAREFIAQLGIQNLPNRLLHLQATNVNRWWLYSHVIRNRMLLLLYDINCLRSFRVSVFDYRAISIRQPLLAILKYEE